jgi:hypothetical protein
VAYLLWGFAVCMALDCFVGVVKGDGFELTLFTPYSLCEHKTLTCHEQEDNHEE